MRWNNNTQIGTDIENHLKRMRFDLGRQYEFDTARPILGMVAAGLGWAVMPPLWIFEMLQVRNSIRSMPFPGPSFFRTISVFASRKDEHIARRIAAISSRIFLDLYADEIVSVAPWLRFESSVDSYLIRARPA